jgi:ATP-dependent exoDNAse (exonuclease V) alpha subunit
MTSLHSTSKSYRAEYRRNQLPILNAFALTIHKVQGLSLPSVTMALNCDIFSDGQAYVGLSRGRELEQLFLSHLDFRVIKADPKAIAEYDRLRAKAAEFALQCHWIPSKHYPCRHRSILNFIPAS